MGFLDDNAFKLANGTELSYRQGNALRVNSFGDEDGSNHGIEVYNKESGSWEALALERFTSLSAARERIQEHEATLSDAFFEVTEGNAGTPDARYQENKAQSRSNEKQSDTSPYCSYE